MKISRKTFFVSLLLLLFLLIGLLIVNKLTKTTAKIKPTANNDVLSLISEKSDYRHDSEANCVTGIEKRIIRGNSLSGLIDSGSTVTILTGFYDCNEVKRGDIVIYKYAGNENPIIKVVKGIPEDKFSLLKSGSNWRILINGEKLKNSLGSFYTLDERKYKILSLYQKDYNGIIPYNSYLLLGNDIGGTLDSTRFGLVYKSGIIGKAILE